MKFEELSSIWNSSDTALGKNVTINKKLVKELGFTKVKSRLYEIKWAGYFKIGVWSIFLIFLMGFIFNNLSDFKLSFSAIILLTITLFSLIFEIYRLTMYYSIDSTSPVIEAQKKLTRLKYFDVLDTYSLYIIIPLFSAPFVIVIVKAFVNYNLYTFGMTWVILYTTGSIFIAVIVTFLLRKYPNKTLTELIAFLNELKENQN